LSLRLADPPSFEIRSPAVRRVDPSLDPEEERDRELMSRIRSGDKDAFRSLFRRYAPTAMALARRVLRQPNLAEETVQEAFLAVWKSPERFDPTRGSVRAWLMSAVHHRAVDLIRREEAQRRRSQEAGADPRVEPSDDPGVSVVEDVSLMQARVEVRRALEALPEAQRRVVELMYFDGYTQTRIAELLGLPLGTVKSRSLLGMRRLRGVLLGMER
jgi:RNA polymerase sigma-70 factor (ECF subfamily)